jgi:hypothetical protein
MSFGASLWRAHSDVDSRASSTRHIILDADMSALEPPSAPFTSPRDSLSFSTKNASSTSESSALNRDSSGLSLSVNYLPKKFSNPALLALGVRKRRNGKDPTPAIMPKLGGGVEAFRTGEARMPGESDEDYDGVSGDWFGGKTSGPKKPKLRWNRFKWILFFANILVGDEAYQFDSYLKWSSLLFRSSQSILS